MRQKLPFAKTVNKNWRVFYGGPHIATRIQTNLHLAGPFKGAEQRGHLPPLWCLREFNSKPYPDKQSKSSLPAESGTFQEFNSLTTSPTHALQEL